jgi:hypothetical protein
MTNQWMATVMLIMLIHSLPETIYIDDLTYTSGDAACPTQTYPVTFTDTCSSQIGTSDGASISFESGYATVSNTNGGTWANIQFDHAALVLSSQTKGFSVRVIRDLDSQKCFTSYKWEATAGII